MCGLPVADGINLRRAALVHDLGFHGVPATILDKAAPLSASESERMRLHAYYTERMLARPPALARIGAVASMVNERIDGSGYHRGLSGPAIPAAGRILAAADAFQAMTEPVRTGRRCPPGRRRTHCEPRFGAAARPSTPSTRF